MKNINLFKVTVMVITAALASNFVNAEDKISTAIESSQPTMAKVEQQLSFPALITELDGDANGMLSQDEVAVSHLTFLQEEFNNIDANQDGQIEEAEFNSFIAQLKDKVTDMANTED
ncbi:hypothetical protein Q4506_15425 [Colwellia sp. 4_MG-2023]|uniref:hypothetical protein n=1 Tax=unclassified Colwellia TaxID=196834 RepID=UPI001C087098|nr:MULTISPECIES: hypothetical protein [unclassified Colwellia]MBU2923838.1 hypothetical protein [Colwellia sp. C2M11]MDO6508439.1 hypothetical protein [Colwellia sp. 5_MG-2023]MDO6557074.1 hypothetical protein [Colwellia sp. 4_MG-2023]MDO6651914.1 hypothetical protein [Colwellia sp. 3_MG-2023]MDO6666875.1 hypothetical protein [Colwellia sp. 2_MG-2023]